MSPRVRERVWRGSRVTETLMSAEANLRTGSLVKRSTQCFSARRQSMVLCWHGSKGHSWRLACLMQRRESCLRRLLVLGSEDKRR
jgi:hypothetical protein